MEYLLSSRRRLCTFTHVTTQSSQLYDMDQSGKSGYAAVTKSPSQLVVYTRLVSHLWSCSLAGTPVPLHPCSHSETQSDRAATIGNTTDRGSRAKKVLEGLASVITQSGSEVTHIILADKSSARTSHTAPPKHTGAEKHLAAGGKLHASSPSYICGHGSEKPKSMQGSSWAGS